MIHCQYKNYVQFAVIANFLTMIMLQKTDDSLNISKIKTTKLHISKS